MQNFKHSLTEQQTLIHTTPQKKKDQSSISERDTQDLDDGCSSTGSTLANIQRFMDKGGSDFFWRQCHPIWIRFMMEDGAMYCGTQAGYVINGMSIASRESIQAQPKTSHYH